MGEDEREWHPAGKVGKMFRGLEFWKRASGRFAINEIQKEIFLGIYLSYKVTQARAKLLHAAGYTEQKITETLWKPHNAVVGQRMYDLCVDLRGFYLKARFNHRMDTLLSLVYQGGQFLGTRADFIPEEICTQLSKLHDQVENDSFISLWQEMF